MVELSQTAQDHIRTFSTEHRDEISGKFFRIYVEGGGCSGFQYGFTFDELKEGDEKIALPNGMTILIDAMSINYLSGSTVDYVDDFRGAGFLVKNPQATSTCGCGQSFSI